MRDEHLHEGLAALVGPENVFISESERLACLRVPFSSQSPPILPSAVIYPQTPSQAAKILKFCNSRKISIRIRGNGSAIFPLPFPQSEPWILLKTASLSKIVDFSPENLTITLQAGVTCEQLSAFLENKGYWIPTLDGFHGRTIGGLLAENQAYGQFAKFGPASSALAELKICLSNGEIHAVNGALGSCARANQEPPLAQLFCGSKGAYGCILEAVLKILPRPAEKNIVAFQGPLKTLCQIAFSLQNPLIFPDAATILASPVSQLHNLPYSPALVLSFSGTSGHLAVIKNMLETICGSYNLKLINLPDAFVPAPQESFTSLTAGKSIKHPVNFACAPSQLAQTFNAIEKIISEGDIEAIFYCYPYVAAIRTLFCSNNPQRWASAKKELTTLRQLLNETFVFPDIKQNYSQTPELAKIFSKCFDAEGILGSGFLYE